MKTYSKNIALSLIFSLFLMAGSQAKADCLGRNCITPNTDSVAADKMQHDEFDLDFEDPFFFSSQIVVHIYNKQDELIYNKAFTKEEADKDPELKALLKTSDFLLSIDDKHFYYLKN